MSACPLNIDMMKTTINDYILNEYHIKYLMAKRNVKTVPFISTWNISFHYSKQFQTLFKEHVHDHCIHCMITVYMCINQKCR